MANSQTPDRGTSPSNPVPITNFALPLSVVSAVAGFIAAVAGVLSGTTLGVLTAGMTMAVAGTLGSIGSRRHIYWFSLTFGGVGISFVVLLSLLSALPQ